ncbi:hypothetical protein, partial [Pseudomonas syringae group genomosp. 7]|uniref:hypothetical protein n=1 Tax=Pseudomonas syringae group genomosp. 7 TaxID=251699 RepID=UPI0037702E23
LSGHLEYLIERESVILKRIAVLCVKSPYQLSESFTPEAKLGRIEITIPLARKPDKPLLRSDGAATTIAALMLPRGRYT